MIKLKRGSLFLNRQTEAAEKFETWGDSVAYQAKHIQVFSYLNSREVSKLSRVVSKPSRLESKI